MGIMTIPETQFEVFILQCVKPDGRTYVQGVYQTFGQAYDKISELTHGHTLIEVEEKYESSISYYCSDITTNWRGTKLLLHNHEHFKISMNLFTYKDSQDLVTDNYYWLRDRNKDYFSKIT